MAYQENVKYEKIPVMLTPSPGEFDKDSGKMTHKKNLEPSMLSKYSVHPNDYLKMGPKTPPGFKKTPQVDPKAKPAKPAKSTLTAPSSAPLFVGPPTPPPEAKKAPKSYAARMFNAQRDLANKASQQSASRSDRLDKIKVVPTGTKLSRLQKIQTGSKAMGAAARDDRVKQDAEKQRGTIPSSDVVDHAARQATSDAVLARINKEDSVKSAATDSDAFHNSFKHLLPGATPPAQPKMAKKLTSKIKGTSASVVEPAKAPASPAPVEQEPLHKATPPSAAAQQSSTTKRKVIGSKTKAMMAYLQSQINKPGIADDVRQGHQMLHDSLSSGKATATQFNQYFKRKNK